MEPYIITLLIILVLICAFIAVHLLRVPADNATTSQDAAIAAQEKSRLEIEKARLEEKLQALAASATREAAAQKESAEREKDEALKLAQAMYEENKKLKGSVNQGQTVLLEQAKKVINSEIEEAKRLYKEAYESGDADNLLDDQEAHTSATIRADKVNKFKPAPLQEEETPV